MWIHLLTLGLIDGAGGEQPPEPIQYFNSGGIVRYVKKYKEDPPEEVKQTVIKVIKQLPKKATKEDAILRLYQELAEFEIQNEEKYLLALDIAIEQQPAYRKYQEELYRQQQEEEAIFMALVALV